MKSINNYRATWKPHVPLVSRSRDPFQILRCQTNGRTIRLEQATGPPRWKVAADDDNGSDDDNNNNKTSKIVTLEGLHDRLSFRTRSFSIQNVSF